MSNIDRLIELIFGEPHDDFIANGSNGIDDDSFTIWLSADEAELYA